MKIKFKMDIKCPGKRSCYTKITDINALNDETFMTWMLKNFENVINNQMDEVDDNTVIIVEYTDIDNDMTYKHVVNFENDSYVAYVNNDEIANTTLSDMLLDAEKLLNDVFCQDKEIEMQTECETEDDPAPECNDGCLDTDTRSLYYMVMDRFAKNYAKSNIVRMLTDEIVTKVKHDDYIFVSDSFNEYEESDVLPVGIMIDISEFHLNMYTQVIRNKVLEYIVPENFSSAMFNDDYSKLVLIF